MADADNGNEELAKAIAADFGDEVVENPVTPAAEEPKKPEENAATPPAPNAEEPKKDDPKDPNKEDEEPETPPADPAKPTEGDPAAPKDPNAPSEEEEQPKPLTEDGILRIINKAQNDARNETQVLRNAYNEVMEAYYPEGLSNVLVDQSTGKELRTPQDVVDASGGEMTHEQAAQWLMNKQFELDNNIQNIQRQAAQIAETNVNFRRDAAAMLHKYEPLFKAYPHLQEKAYNLMMKQVRYDKERDLITQAPDVVELYDTYLEPYQMALEAKTNQPATNPTTPPATPPAPATPSQDDRLDEGGDGGAGTGEPADDPTNFAQQVTKELAKGF